VRFAEHAIVLPDKVSGDQKRLPNPHCPSPIVLRAKKSKGYARTDEERGSCDKWIESEYRM